MYENLNKLKIFLTDAEIQTFKSFSEYFLCYNSKVNLISGNDSKYLYEKHIYDSFAFNLFYEKYAAHKKENIKLMDIGTGGGFPAIPIALKYKNIDVTAIDSINKKINFIKSVSNKFTINNLYPECKRAEELNRNMRESFDIVTSRAMARLNIILEYSIPYIKQGGYFIAYKSIKADEEIEEAQNALKILNSKVIEKIEYTLPIEEENKRVLIIIKKTESTKEEYPRKNGLIKKSPL